MGVLDWLKNRKPGRAAAEAAYAACIERSRNAAFYTACGVEDTVDGRFDMLVLHCALVLRRMKAAGPQGAALGEQFMEVMVRDLDANIRELGTSDIGVPRKVRAMVEAFYGRAGAYHAAFETGERGDLVAALGRNVYRSRVESVADAERLAADASALEAALAALDDTSVLAGTITMPPPATGDAR